MRSSPVRGWRTRDASAAARTTRNTASRLGDIVSQIEQRLAELGFELPAPLQLPPGAALPFPWVRIVDNRALVSGHGPTDVNGALARPLGKVGRDVSIDQGYAAARLAGLAILGSLKRALGDLDRIDGWCRVFGMVNSAPGFNRQPAVINGFTELIVDVFGREKGAHARSAVGMAELPFDIPVEIEAEVALVGH
jgi:enamine deaminase RidA (YjgF/YER057c/UK114 family)